MIELDGVEHGYDERPVLRGITATLTERRIGIIGGNGSGKSTLARMLNGLIVPKRGTVRVDGLDTARDGRSVRRRVGFVFQNPDVQIVYPTVAEDLAFGLKPFKLPKAEVAARVDAVLARYGLERYRNHPAHLLSGGEKQLLAIAAVLVTDPAHVVFDEPTTLLDRRNRRHVRAVIDGLAQTAIVITHDLDLLDGFDRVLVVEDGRIVADDTPAAAIAAYIARIG